MIMGIIKFVKRLFGWNLPYKSVIHASNELRIKMLADRAGLDPNDPDNWVVLDKDRNTK